MFVLSKFLKFSLNFLFDNLKKYCKIGYSQGEKRCPTLNCQKHSLKEPTGKKSPVKPTWSEKMVVLSIFLECLLNFLSNNIKNTTKFGTVREKSGV